MLFATAHKLTRALVRTEGGDYRATFVLCLAYLRDGGDLQTALRAMRLRVTARDLDAKRAAVIERATADLHRIPEALRPGMLAIIEHVRTHPPKGDGASQIRKGFRTLRAGHSVERAIASL
jgi:hypothetical protein